MDGVKSHEVWDQVKEFASYRYRDHSKGKGDNDVLQRAVNEVVTYRRNTDWIASKYLVFHFNSGRLFD